MNHWINIQRLGSLSIMMPLRSHLPLTTFSPSRPPPHLQSGSDSSLGMDTPPLRLPTTVFLMCQPSTLSIRGRPWQGHLRHLTARPPPPCRPAPRPSLLWPEATHPQTLKLAVVNGGCACWSWWRSLEIKGTITDLEMINSTNFSLKIWRQISSINQCITCVV